MATKRSSVKKKKASATAESSTALTVPGSPWTMKACMAVLGAKGAAAWNVVASLGPRALALWPAASKNLLSHQMGKDAIAGWRNALDRENADYAEVEKVLISKVPTASPEERVEIQQKIEFLRGMRCQGNVVAKALAHLATKPDPTPSLQPPQTDLPGSETQGAVISEHWTDHFNRFARQRNEPWREQLLARALAKESENPGSVSSRLLWILGTLESEKFECLAALFDLATMVNTSPIIPGENVWFDNKPIPGLDLPKMTLGVVMAALSDTGLIQSINIVRNISKDETIKASYDGLIYSITCKDFNDHFSGILFTSLGGSLASLYDQTPNDYGRKLFKDWIENLLPSRYTITKV